VRGNKKKRVRLYIFIKGNTKKTLGKRKVTEGTKHDITFILKDNYDGFKCHISKEDYGGYEVVVLYN